MPPEKTAERAGEDPRHGRKRLSEPMAENIAEKRENYTFVLWLAFFKRAFSLSVRLSIPFSRILSSTLSISSWFGAGDAGEEVDEGGSVPGGV